MLECKIRSLSITLNFRSLYVDDQSLKQFKQTFTRIPERENCS
jgi:hypothetical protein